MLRKKIQWQIQVYLKKKKLNKIRPTGLAMSKINCKYKSLKKIYHFENGLTGLVAEPVKSAVKANASMEANQSCLHELFSRK